MHCISDRMCSKNGCWIAKTTPPPCLGKIPLFFSCLLFIEPPYVTTVLQQLEENLKNLFGRKKSKMVARFQSRSLQCSGVRWQGWLGKSPHWHLGSSLLVKQRTHLRVALDLLSELYLVSTHKNTEIKVSGGSWT